MVKVTFTVDEETARRIQTMAERLRKPKSMVVREAVAEYAVRAGKLGEEERRALLRTFDRVVARVPARPASAVDMEIRSVRVARRQGGRRGRGRP